MPPSPSCNRKPILCAISNVISSDNLDKINILDLGIGKGDFGELIKKNIKIPVTITGVEIWEKYRNRKWGYYDKLIITDIGRYLAKNNKRYDIILLIDVLEHFTGEKGREVLDKTIKIAKKAIIVSTPITRYPQKAVRGNPYEEHKSFWTSNKLMELSFKEVDRKQIFGLFWPPLAKLGIYIYKK